MRSRHRHLALFSALACSMFAFFAFSTALPAQAQQSPAVPSISSVIETYKQALMKLDGATVASLFSDDVVISDLGTVAKGKADAIAQLRQAVQENPNLQVSFSDTSYSLDTAIERAAFTSDTVRAGGASRLWEIETFVVNNGKIVSYTAVFDTSDAETARFVAAMAGQ